MPSLPPELIPLILAEFPEDSKALRNCALVCQSWARISRSISFHSLSVTGYGLPRKRRARRVARFLRLCASPFETFSKSNIHTLELWEWPHSPYDFDPAGQHLEINALLGWCSADGTKTISSLFPFLKRLSFLGDISWRSLSGVAKKAIYEGFMTVTELSLNYIHIDTEDFLTLIHTFPSLWSLELDFINQLHLSDPKTLVTVPHTNLQKIVLDYVRTLDFIRLFHGTPCLKILHLHGGSIFFKKFVNSNEVRAAITRLLRSTTLEEFRCEYRFNKPTEVDKFLAKLDLTGLSNLRQIEFEFHTYVEGAAFPSSLPDFFDKLSTSNDTISSSLEVVSIPYLPEHTRYMDFQKLDEILQRPYFSSLRELKCSFTCDFTQKDVAKQLKRGKRTYPQPDSDSAAESDLRERKRDFGVMYFPKCEARGILVTNHEYCYNPPPRFRDKIAGVAGRTARNIRSRTSGAMNFVTDSVQRLVRLG
ncbi:hypothetical protein Moror_8670 [Moniliophthora roreri MCA 2997]|uniref:Uncharacterized protein n=2 Tax=Moniliophthora roreri TaxID=221103 RepID=V2YD34_MONRO|nr:hypothetical protein Moror_8670 [Moniliophthora roreri MCA 2997]